MSDLLILDTVDVATLQGLRFDGLAGYVGGSWPTFHPMVAAYPDLAKAGRIFSYAVNVSEDADWCDCEQGDLTVQEAAEVWIPRMLNRNVWRPGCYANLSRWDSEGLRELTNHFGEQIRRIVAAWTFNPVISVAWAEMQQYTDRYQGRNIDGNIAHPSIVPPQQQPPHVNQPHYDWFASGPISTYNWGEVDERQVAEGYDALRKIAHRDPDQEHGIHRLMSISAGLANRVTHYAFLDRDSKGRPNWALHHRGWRRLQLSMRGHGHQVNP